MDIGWVGEAGRFGGDVLAAMTVPVGAVIAGATSSAVTSIVWHCGRRRRLRRLLRRALVHPDPDRRVAALYVAGLDGLRHHLDLIVDCALTESADVVLTSLVDLVMDEEWGQDRDGLMAALRAWAEDFVAEQGRSRAPCLRGSPCPDAPAPHGCPANSIEVIELADYGFEPPKREGGSSRRSVKRAWARSGAAPEIDALEVVEALASRNGRARRRAAGARPTSPAEALAKPGDGDAIFDELVAEVLTLAKRGRSTPTPLRRAAGPRSSAVTPVAVRGTGAGVSAAAGQ
ncbi:MAG: hypothetical protein M3144_10865 [Actinomycetota bacterium]|nr:hypothetical protein [Actinomycetota bacterium]